MSIRPSYLFFPLVLIFFAIKPASAQVQFGVKTGWSITNVNSSSNQTATVNGTSQAFKNFPKTGWTGGIFFTIPVYKHWQFQPELNYSNQGAEGSPKQQYTYTVDESYRLNYLNIPLLVKYKGPFGIFAETGPQFSLLLKGSIHETVVGNDNTQYYNVKSAFKSNDFGWVFGAGYLSPINLGLDVRYNLGLSNINQATAAQLSSAPLQSGSMKNSVFQLTLFYVFGKSGLKSGASRSLPE
ncbi:MAG: porin family protein [Ilumatobacteraceae bacterium]